MLLALPPAKDAASQPTVRGHCRKGAFEIISIRELAPITVHFCLKYDLKFCYSFAENSFVPTTSSTDTPYGMPWQQVGTQQTVYGFTGESLDGNGLLHLRARYYDPTTGIFTSIDPLESVNRYSYVSGNPINFVDPSGMQEIGSSPCGHGGLVYGTVAVELEDIPNYELYLVGNYDTLDGLHPSDANQGYLGTCTLIASIGAIATHSEGRLFIKENIITPNDDGTFNVRLYERDPSDTVWMPIEIQVKPQKATFRHTGDCTVAATSIQIDDTYTGPVMTHEEVWALVLENAYAWKLGNMYDNTRSDAEKKMIGYLVMYHASLRIGERTANRAPTVLGTLLGSEAVFYYPEDVTYENITDWYNSQYAIVLGTFQSNSEVFQNNVTLEDKEANEGFYGGSYNLNPNHAYYVSRLGVDDQGYERIYLRNPWGWNNPEIPLKPEHLYLFSHISVSAIP